MSFGNLWIVRCVYLLAGMTTIAIPSAGVAQTTSQAIQASEQNAKDPQASQANTGSATGGIFAPILDSEKRPITAGGFVKTGPIVYQDVSQKAGLPAWHHRMGNPEKNYILETTGSGVALLDY